MASLLPFQPEYAQKQIRRAYLNTLSPSEIREMQQSLIEHKQDWENLLTDSDSDSPHELSTSEADALLQHILHEISAPSASSSPTSPAPQPPSHRWTLSWRSWLIVPTTALLLFTAWPWLSPVVPPPTSSWTGKKNGSSASHAFLQISWQRTQKGTVQKRAFKPNGFYELGDIFYFRFLIIEKGYVYLIRQDSKDRLEQLFPFQPGKHTFLPGGRHYAVEFQGKPIPYVLEQDIVGYQTFLLIHSHQPLTWPKHVKELTQQQQHLFQQSDRVHFTVLPQTQGNRHRTL